MVVNISKDKLTHFKFPESLLQVLFTFRRTWQWFLPAIALLLFPPYSLFPVSLPRRIYAVGTRWGSEINQCPWQIYATKITKMSQIFIWQRPKTTHWWVKLPLVGQTDGSSQTSHHLLSKYFKYCCVRWVGILRPCLHLLLKDWSTFK